MLYFFHDFTKYDYGNDIYLPKKKFKKKKFVYFVYFVLSCNIIFMSGPLFNRNN